VALTVYGKVPAAQNVPVASYGDTVVATVTF
jgi:spore coat protein U-like protein